MGKKPDFNDPVVQAAILSRATGVPIQVVQPEKTVTVYGRKAVVIDLRTAEDHEILAWAATECSSGNEKADELIKELEAIGHATGFLRPTKTKKNAHQQCLFNSSNHHIRARQIGEQLNEIGGLKLMAMARHRVGRKFKGARRFGGRELEFAWDGIGEWHA